MTERSGRTGLFGERSAHRSRTRRYSEQQLVFERRPEGRLSSCQVRTSRLDGGRSSRFNRVVHLYALVAADSEFAVDVFTTRRDAEAALADVLFDEPAFAPLLDIVAVPPPWLDGERAFATDPR
jgi:hypothetical protein